MREAPNISVDQLRTCLREQYALSASTLEFLPRGHDYLAGVYRVMDEQGGVYLLKVTARPLYAASCLVPRYLCDQGISAVVAPLPTTSGSLWTAAAGWTVIVYPFLDGESTLTGMTTAHWTEVGTIFRLIHQAPLPPAGFASVRIERFDPSNYVRWMQAFESDHLSARHRDSGVAGDLYAAWDAHQPTIHTGLTLLETLAPALQASALPRVICHADLHAANLLRDPVGRVHVIDWDEVMLAPEERDFIFIRGPHADAFEKGYGPHAMDWTALTYFRWERVIQDLIEEAQQAVCRDEVGEEARATAVQRFEATFAPGGNVDAAKAAAAELEVDT